MDALKPYLPQGEGLLPWWLFILSIISIGNSFQAYATTFYTKRIYCGPPKAPGSPPTPAQLLTRGHDLTRSPATPLSTRTFGTWTLITSIVRLYAAYNVHDKGMYQLAMWSYVVAWGHFMSEWWVFGTTRMGLPLFFPALIATGGLAWMVNQYGYYVQ